MTTLCKPFEDTSTDTIYWFEFPEAIINKIVIEPPPLKTELMIYGYPLPVDLSLVNNWEDEQLFVGKNSEHMLLKLTYDEKPTTFPEVKVTTISEEYMARIKGPGENKNIPHREHIDSDRYFDCELLSSDEHLFTFKLPYYAVREIIVDPVPEKMIMHIDGSDFPVDIDYSTYKPIKMQITWENATLNLIYDTPPTCKPTIKVVPMTTILSEASKRPRVTKVSYLPGIEIWDYGTITVVKPV